MRYPCCFLVLFLHLLSRIFHTVMRAQQLTGDAYVLKAKPVSVLFGGPWWWQAFPSCPLTEAKHACSAMGRVHPARCGLRVAICCKLVLKLRLRNVYKPPLCAGVMGLIKHHRNSTSCFTSCMQN